MKSHYKFHGADTVALAKKYGTPLYLMSEDFIVDRCREVNNSFLKKYDNTFAVYAGKAFSTKEMCRIISREGLGLDVVSGGELFTALSVDFPVEKILFHGNNKSYDELRFAVNAGVGRIVVDNLTELKMVQEIGYELSTVVTVLFRVSPGVDSHTHHYISTGQLDSKFGIPLVGDILKSAVIEAMNASNINLAGFHFHVGSQLFENNSHLMATKILLSVMKDLHTDLNFKTRELNVGGGFGIYYKKGDLPQKLSYFVDPIMELIVETCHSEGLERPCIIIEPGRWIVGEAGITLYSIGAIKDIPTCRKYVSVDGGMPDNVRPALYEAQYDAVVANKMEDDKTELVTIAGKCCESGDILIKDLDVPVVEPGDILAVKSTGAYGYAMSSNYNKLPVPAVVMLKGGLDRIIVNRQSYEEVIAREL